MKNQRRWQTALFLSLVWPGLGQMYNGQLRKTILYTVYTVGIFLLLIAAWALLPDLVTYTSPLVMIILCAVPVLIAVEAVISARRIDDAFVKKPYHRWYYYIVTALGIMTINRIAALIIIFYFTQAFKIPTGSMEDTLLPGDFILGNKVLYGTRLHPFTDRRFPGLARPAPGDIIIFRYPGKAKKDFVKRIVARSGQTVSVIDTTVLVNGAPVHSPGFIKHTDSCYLPPDIKDFAPLRIPAPSDHITLDSLPVREQLFMKYLIAQENPKHSVRLDVQCYVNGSPADRNPMFTYAGRKNLPATMIPFDDIDNWFILTTTFATLLPVHSSDSIMIMRRIMFDGKPLHEYTVKYDNYFVMGDNRENALDSRFWGFVNKPSIKAKPLIIYFSIRMPDFENNVMPRIRWERIGQKLQ